MPLNDIGPVGYHQAQAVASLAFTPQYDRAAIVTRLLIDKPSAADVWRITVAGREVAAFDIQVTGNQQPLAGPYSGYPKNNDLFNFIDAILGYKYSFPIPMGQTFTVKSDGGATANIEIEYTEVSPAEINPGMANHPAGNRFIVPLVLYRAATTAVTGEVALDTQVGPTWFPNLAVANQIPSNWRLTCRGIFLEGGSRNTFSGAADHLSNTTYLAVLKNGLRMFTRDNAGGLPLVGQAAAAGSANSVVGTDQTPYPPFQEANLTDFRYFSPPLAFGGGDEYTFLLNIAGDVTGGATYAGVRQMLLVDTITG